MNIAVFHGLNNMTNTVSYQHDWVDAFVLNQKVLGYKCDIYSAVNIDIFNMLKVIRKYDVIVALHSLYSNGRHMNYLMRTGILNFRKGKLVWFVGNEGMKGMKDKIDLIKFNNADYVCSSFVSETSSYIYAETKAKILSIPNALNSENFFVIKNINNRKIDIGSRAYEYVKYIGDNDRVEAIKKIAELSKKSALTIDVSFDSKDRFDMKNWNIFLNNIKCTVSTEAGYRVAQRDDNLRKKVLKYMAENQDVTANEINEVFYKNLKDSYTGKQISSRHFEAIGTKTCQILLEGRYNDILKPNEHYIELKKDFSNADEVIEKMKDDKLREKIVERAYEYVISNHTHKHRIEYLLKEISKK